ncbi:hypothetical protein C1J03_04760 [Sulfitobacter sp. SK012]|uniref:hypothetical protein n=1 Tax=Sulfitobacter sp. SK012 TaxID=1389005 RepID=UPI000E0C932E|nr:hypothetical protein [Sulfitobacter sp. SK012]AXI45409.1 hypothetical protein C1J03_04760 [Sulfitobacter sp. SK012]
MTALTKYDRIEATGLWRPDAQAQRREVIVSIGDATLMISDSKDQAITHWSLAAVARVNPDEYPAIFHPDGDTSETLELPENETVMIAAIEKLRRAVNRTRPRPGRLRFLGVGLSIAAVLALGVFWLPGAMQDNTLRVVPQVKRKSLGTALLDRLQRVSGPRCSDAVGSAALTRLGLRLGVSRLAVLPNLTQPALHLPGGLIVINRSVIEDYEEPDVAAGYILAEVSRRATLDPLRPLLSVAGPWENFRLLTTGDLAPETLDAYAEHLLSHPAAPPKDQPLLELFGTAQLRSTPYAMARDITGETVLELVEGDPMQGKNTEPLLTDGDWLRLQSICGG